MQGAAALAPGGCSAKLRFIDRDEHVYFWFPLLAGLSELTFDPRQEIRYSALEVRMHLLIAFAQWGGLPVWVMN